MQTKDIYGTKMGNLSNYLQSIMNENYMQSDQCIRLIIPLWTGVPSDDTMYL